MSCNIGVILGGGLGTRFKGTIPKQYVKLNGKEIIAYSIEAFTKAKALDAFVVVVDEKSYKNGSVAEKYGVDCILGGNSRNASVRNALHYIKVKYPDCKNVMIHEAARPFITSEIIDTYMGYLTEYDAVITTKTITDSLGKVGQHVVDRSEYYLIQAPEAFDFQLLADNFSPDSPITATVQQMPESATFKCYYDFVDNHKVTFAEDLGVYEQLMKHRLIKDIIDK